MAPYDTPYVDLAKPPASPTQPVKEADKRGWDHAVGTPHTLGTGTLGTGTLGGGIFKEDEYLKATAYREHLVNLTRKKRENLLRLAGSKEAYKSLQRKTLALADSSPPYIEADV